MEGHSSRAEIKAKYRGRFAPTPSGPLHFGSLVAAVGSYLEAKRNQGEWLVRMEDLDLPRVVPGAADDILRTLETFGFEWTGPVMRQSERTEAYCDSFERLRAPGMVYPCGCSRAMQEGSACVAKCCDGLAPGRTVRSWRVRVTNEPICWLDRLNGPQSDDLVKGGGDFVVLRGDGVFAYQLAVVVDDAEQEIVDVVRGADLLDSTARQVWLQRLLGYRLPEYLHLPIAKNELGEKLSKQTRAPALSKSDPAGELRACLRFLGQPVPEMGTLREVWHWATAEWNPVLIPIQAATECSSSSGVAAGRPR